ncbi:2-methylaconitate cis-trans isomerase PrpF [Candidimonas nitroreducens]|uniref:2-methylaconitate cis-trans isomerase PrpF n=1 Tax=Candidimonas nitroreducens TaxID=683354 RepID=A0A225MSA4_9BURK|nr:2-methylaconitate cis-trans isomerase PrpF [Candidimonas nitroreducens]OWT64108.1 2-methylaconitate cis-trans isomerase PrpF [Candidimonas nitroreducens]
MTTQRQTRIPALYMRGGTSKGVFFLPDDLPTDPARRDAVLLRVIGSPDPYEKQIDGMGGAASSTSKVVIIGKSDRPDCDVDYLFGQVAIDRPLVDWSGNCGNLTAAVGPFAIHRGLVQAPRDGVARVTIWQANIGKKIVAHVPMRDGQVQELGDFVLDGVTFPAAEIRLEFLDPGADAGEDGGAGGSATFPTGKRIDELDVPGVGKLRATLINAGNPGVFLAAADLGLAGTEAPAELARDAALLARLEAIRAHAAVAMGLAESAEYATSHRQHTPKLAYFAAAAPYVASSGKAVGAEDIDLLARIISMGKPHHAMTGTGAVGIAAAAAIPGTIVSEVLGGTRDTVCFGHPSGVLRVGAEAREEGGNWIVTKVSMSRSARRLMEGHVYVPQKLLD